MTTFHFVHAADIHLGFEQYNLVARANDFKRAYLEMTRYAVDTRANFVLIAGDLFHRSNADAWMLRDAIDGLSVLRDAGIPVIAIEGNHDAQHARKHMSWMEFLCHQELLVLLNIEVAANGHKRLVPFDISDRVGSWIDVCGARIYGMKYYGAATAKYLEEVRDGIEAAPVGFTILMLHAGMQGQVPHLHGGLTASQLEPLRPVVDYLALGHVHKRLEEAWIFNPGSTETNSMEESDWPHGFFDVIVDTEALPKFRVEPVATPALRPFRRISASADGSETLEILMDQIEKSIAEHPDIPKGAVVELQVGGVAGFNRQELPIERLKGLLEHRFEPLVARVRNNLVAPGLVPVRHGERLRRAELERTVVEQLVRASAGHQSHVAEWTRLVLDVKNMAAHDETAPATIADHVRHALRDVAEGSADGVAEESEIERPAAEPVAAAADPEGAEAGTRPELDLATIVEPLDEPMGGEPPCYAHLFEDW